MRLAGLRAEGRNYVHIEHTPGDVSHHVGYLPSAIERYVSQRQQVGITFGDLESDHNLTHMNEGRKVSLNVEVIKGQMAL